MLSIFPDLLTFGIFSAFILRIAVGIFFFQLGWLHLRKEREKLTKELRSRLGSIAPSYALLIGLIECVLGILFIAGFLTQIAALFGILIGAKAWWFKKTMPTFAHYEKTTYLFVVCICISLLLTGAGVPAIDLPL